MPTDVTYRSVAADHSDHNFCPLYSHLIIAFHPFTLAFIRWPTYQWSISNGSPMSGEFMLRFFNFLAGSSVDASSAKALMARTKSFDLV